MRMRSVRLVLAAIALLPGVVSELAAAVYNLRVVTDASPDYSDLGRMVGSMTKNWEAPEQKCWAVFYWNHKARRQTAPMVVHGLAVTDPIRQFNDYGYAMCSTIAGINCSIWAALGFPAKYWDISLHTVAEVEYGGGWHMYDNSMTALYTLCDGRTLASVAEIGQPGACAASEGRTEPGHIARYHCLTATSPRGFLTGADTIRSLEEEYRCFNPNGLKYRSYFYDWDGGHRYILNLRDHESYTRYYHKRGDSREYFVPNEGKDPEKANERYRIRGNGVRSFDPALTEGAWQTCAQGHSNLTAVPGGGVGPSRLGEPGEIVFKVEGANVMTSLKIQARFRRRTVSDANRVLISSVNGLAWKEVWRNAETGDVPLELNLVDEVNGSYEVLVKVSLLALTNVADAQLESIGFEVLTMLNSKTQPNLLLGRNTVHVEAGPPLESIVIWPDLQGENYLPYVAERRNVTTEPQHPGYQAVLHAVRPNEEAHVVFRLDAPREITRLVYGGRLYNRAPGSHIDFLHSFDEGRTWVRSYSLTNTAQPWDVIHYEEVDRIPAGTRLVLCKYLMEGSAAGPGACGLYAVRLEANHEPAEPESGPLEVTFNWSERQPDYSLVERSHTEWVSKRPHRYTINVGGADHPVVNWLRVRAQDEAAGMRGGYSDGRDVGGRKHVSRWVTYGRNLARGKPYAVTVPSTTQWEAGDPEGTKLTDGVAGPPYPGGIAPRFALCWNAGTSPEITVDLGRVESCGAFRIQLGAGWPWWDALKGEMKDRVELLTSMDGRDYGSQGFFDLNLRWKDLPANHFWPDEEIIAAHLFELIPPERVSARYVRYRITPARTLTVSEVEVLDFIGYEPFDLRIALPGD